jgi:hypothetical protein
MAFEVKVVAGAGGRRVGKTGRKKCSGASVDGVSVRKIPGSHRQSADLGDLTVVCIRCEPSFPIRFAK